MTDLTPQFFSNKGNGASNRVKAPSKDMRYYYSILLNKWYLLALGVLIGAGVFYTKMRYSKNVYKIAGSVLIESSKRDGVNNDVITEKLGFETGVDNMEDRIRLLGSTELMERVVDSLHLNVAYVQEGHVMKNELYNDSPLKLQYWNTEGAAKSFQFKILHHDDTHFKLIKSENESELIEYGKPFNHLQRELILKKIADVSPLYPINIIVQDQYNIAQMYSGRLDIAQVGRSNILNISILDEVPDRGVAIINRLVRQYSASIMETNNESGRRTLRFLDERLSYVTGELSRVERTEEGFKQNRNLPVQIPEMAKTSMDKLSLVDQKIVSLDERLRLAISIEGIVNKASSNIYQTLPFSGTILNNPPLVVAIQQYNDLIAKHNALGSSATPTNPASMAIDEQLNSLRNNIMFNIQTTKQEINTEKEQARQQLLPLENQIYSMPTNQRELTEITREKDVRAALFIFLLQKREETALAVAAQVGHSRLLERASNRGIVSPKPLQLGIFCLLMGLGIPIMFLYLRDLFNTKVYHRVDIDKYLNIPFVGFIPHVRGEKKKLVINDSHSILAESFRLVRSNLQNTATNQKNRTILITSTVSSEGKSFVAVNLALTLALTGKKVIIVGLDLRKPQVGKYLTGVKREKGVSNFLNNEAPLEELIESFTALPNLDYIDCGPIPRNPSELMMTEQMKVMFSYFHQNYDFVIVDGAPIGMVADSFLLKEFVGQTLVVLRYGYSTTANLKFMDDVHMENKLPNMTTVLNDLRTEWGNTYNYGYYLSSYYQEEDGFWGKVKNWMGRKPKNPKQSLANLKTNGVAPLKDKNYVSKNGVARKEEKV
jgi:tyrosine-protein kinase Etk/Wzc